MVKKKCIIMFSGGLDSRLAVKIMQEQGFEVLALFFKLPFLCSCEKKVKAFLRKEKVKFKVFDCTKAKLLQEYLDVIKNPKYGRGAGINPCIDCRIFILKKAKEFADKKGIELIVTGEVAGQRPMSQQKNQIKLIEKEAGLQGRIIRPLIDIGIFGRRRVKQIALAEKFKIKYPHPAGGCLLCEKALKKRLEFLLKRGLNEKEIELIGIGRHFMFGKNWVVLGRDEEENKVIESSRAGKVIEPDFIGPSAVIMGKAPASPTIAPPKKIINKVNKLIQAYSKKGGLKDRTKFDKLKL